MTTPVLVLHGGAGVLAQRSYDREIDHLTALAERTRDTLLAGQSALDAVVEAVADLEASGLYVAGKGSAPNAAGRYELDAAVMDGANRNAGAVSALTGFLSPIRAARAVMETTPHVLLAGKGAEAFAEKAGLAQVGDPDAYYKSAADPDPRPIPTGTVGAVALDLGGRLAAATSTGGTLNKVWGRVGDTPIIADVSARVKYAGRPLAEAVKGALEDVAQLGGEGGLIAVDASGAVTAQFNSPGMKRAIVHSDGRIDVKMS